MRKFSPYLLMASALFSSQGALSAPSIVEMQTNLGTITVKLNEAKAPKTVVNFLTYIQEDFYRNTLIHRSVKNSSFAIIQGGGFDASTGEQKATHDPIINEANNGLKNLRGTLAMARTDDPNSATSQFFINARSNPWNYNAKTGYAGYAVFGQVVKGMNIVDKINSLPVWGSNALPNYPNFQETPLIANKDNTYSFVFVEATYTSDALTPKLSTTRILLGGAKAGSVTSTPAGIHCSQSDPTCVYTAKIGKKLTLTATPDAGSTFAGWSGDCAGAKATLVIPLNGNHNCTAVFN